MPSSPTHEHPVSSHPWWQVMCLTGVDYFSTLGYQPGIAVLAAGDMAPIATLILVLVTLFGALPVYRNVARLSPHGEGSIAMLEHSLPWWHGKFLVLILLGFAGTDFIITITLSAADATAHLVENPLLVRWLHGQEIPLTLILIALLGALFLKGFREVIGFAVVIVVVYLGLNLVVIGMGIYQISLNPMVFPQWQAGLSAHHHNPWIVLGISALLFPKLALGLSGFETGVVVMPLVKGDPTDQESNPVGRIRNTHHLLVTAAVIMSLFLLASIWVTTLLIPTAAFQPGGQANGRALAYLAHRYLGEIFGTVYDLSTITILWFAGASALAGLLNLVPRYLPRYGMAPEWTRAVKPLVIIFMAITFAITLIFRANVDAQGAAYATGVLVLMSSAAIAVALFFHRQRSRWSTGIFAAIALVFIYTTIINIIERPDGIRLAIFFITTIVTTSLISRVFRSTELRVTSIELDDSAQEILSKYQHQSIHLIAHRPFKKEFQEYRQKEQSARHNNHISKSDPLIFLEVDVVDASVFVDAIHVRGIYLDKYQILRVQSSAVPNAIAALLLYLRDQTGHLPSVYFGWTEGNPLEYLLRFLLFGEGDIPILTREVLRKAEPNPQNRPRIHVSG
ncbi:APC family permease [Synechocystis salina]|uniref:APC family permease n=1 Tax=Synechocystis salina LEGE 00031 TaxID=1828736 RepID=A0ABR9VPR7_9SYNC|nr:APC family permease [Synechocystis salina]MBE9240128.1 APC family permease [Synechocystis salina LEGE 00041]MBE9253351.1 APC family permease [Synechocystis salina LEGE 00031]